MALSLLLIFYRLTMSLLPLFVSLLTMFIHAKIAGNTAKIALFSLSILVTVFGYLPDAWFTALPLFVLNIELGRMAGR